MWYQSGHRTRISLRSWQVGRTTVLVVINSLLAARSRGLVQILDEQSAGLLARRMEADEANLKAASVGATRPSL